MKQFLNHLETDAKNLAKTIKDLEEGPMFKSSLDRIEHQLVACQMTLKAIKDSAKVDK